MRKSADSAVLASWLQSQDAKSLWDNHPLDLVVWCWDTLKDLESLHSGGTAGGLVWDHTTDCLVEDTGWSAEMEWTSSGWVVTGHLAEVCVVLDYITNLSANAPKLRLATLHPIRFLEIQFYHEAGVDVRFARKNSPEMLRASQRTTTILCPSRSCLATVEARRPRRWPLPSMVIYLQDTH